MSQRDIKGGPAIAISRVDNYSVQFLNEVGKMGQ